MGDDSYLSKSARTRMQRRDAERTVDRMVREAENDDRKRQFLAGDIIDELERLGWTRKN